MTVTSFEIFRDSSLRYRWRLKRGSVTVANSAGSYTRRADAERATEEARSIAPVAVLRDLTGKAGVIYNLGALHEELRVRWPERPVIRREVRITTPASPTLPLNQPNTRYVIGVNLPQINVQSSDIEVKTGSGVQVGRVFIEKSVKRVKFTGGSYQNIEFQPPYEHTSPDRIINSWVIEDVLFDGVKVDSTSPGSVERSAFVVRSWRVGL